MGMPHYDSASLSEAGKGYIEKPAAMALRAARSGIEIQDSKQNTKIQVLLHRSPMGATGFSSALDLISTSGNHSIFKCS